MAPDTMVVAVVAKDNWNRKVTKVEPISDPDASTNLEVKGNLGVFFYLLSPIHRSYIFVLPHRWRC